LGACRLMQKKHIEAEKSLQESLDISVKKAPNSVARHATESMLGAALAGQKRLAEAEPLLVGSAKALLADAARLSPADKKLAGTALDRVIDYFAAQGNAEESARWRKRRDDAFPAEQKEKQKKTIPSK